MEHVTLKILNFFDERLTEIKNKQEKELEILTGFIKGPELLKDSTLIDAKWKSVVNEHKMKEKALKLIIVGEAPIKLNKYFYINQGNFLDSLTQYWKLKNNKELPKKMLEMGILVLDIFKYPIPPVFYKMDKQNVLLDQNYLNKKINFLKNNGLINDETHFVFRYKQLFNRAANILKACDGCKFIKSKDELVSLNTGEKPQKLNDTVKDYLLKNCK